MLNLARMDSIMDFDVDFAKIGLVATLLFFCFGCKDKSVQKEKESGDYYEIKYYADELSQESAVMKKCAKWENGKAVLADDKSYHALTSKELGLVERLSYTFIIKNVMLPRKDYYRVDRRYFRQFFGYKKNDKVFAIGNFYPFTITKYPKDGCLCCFPADDTRIIFNPFMTTVKDEGYVMLRVNLTDQTVDWY